MGRARIKSKSCSDISSCSTRVYDALSTHEYTKMNASALMYSSYDCRQWKCRTHPNTHVSMQLIASERACEWLNQKRESEKIQVSEVIVVRKIWNDASVKGEAQKTPAMLVTHIANLILIFRAITLVPFWPMMNFISDSTPFKTTDTFCSPVDSRIDAERKR